MKLIFKKISLASDHAGFTLKEIIKKKLIKNKVKVLDFVPYNKDKVDYPDYAKIRAAVCYNSVSTRLSRTHNNANILALGSRLTNKREALKLVNIFLSTKFEGGRHLRRIKKI